MKAQTVVLTTALAGALAAASAAHADDVKVYPGNACQAQNGSQATDFSNFPALIHNFGAAERFVVCPIVRDNDANLNGVKSVRVRVRNPGGATLGCVLFSFSALGNFVASNTNSTTSTGDASLPLDIDVSTNGGTYSLLCTLPPNGRVYGYRVEEF